MVRLKYESFLSRRMGFLKPALSRQVQTKVELGQVIPWVNISSQDKVGSGRGAETNALFPSLDLVGLEVPAHFNVRPANKCLQK